MQGKGMPHQAGIYDSYMPQGKTRESLKSMLELIAVRSEWRGLGYSNRINVYCVDEPAIVPE